MTSTFRSFKKINFIRIFESFDVNLIEFLIIKNFCDKCEIILIKKRSHKNRIIFDRHRNDFIYNDIEFFFEIIYLNLYFLIQTCQVF